LHGSGQPPRELMVTRLDLDKPAVDADTELVEATVVQEGL
jgi:hypothetical protein